MWGNKNTINKTSGGKARGSGRKDRERAKAATEKAERAPAKKLRKPEQKMRKPEPAKKAASAKAEREPRKKLRKLEPGPRPGRAASPSRDAGQTSKVTPDKPAVGRRKAEKEAAGRARFLLRLSPRTVIILLLFVIFIALSASPVVRNLEATGKLKAMERELEKQRKTTASLEKEIDVARSPSYIEEEARRQRMVEPGEVLYLVTTDAAEPRVEYRLKALQSMDEAWEIIRKVLHCNAPRQ
jgi:cell division protein FtsB